MASESYDVIIAGAGPSGTSAAIYLARSGFKTLLLDRSKIGGALSMAREIANYPGLGYEKPISGAELITRMHQHAENFGAEFQPFRVYGFDLSGETRTVFTAEASYSARSVIIATGARERSNLIPGEAQYVGRGVAYCVTCDGPLFRDKTVAIVGNSEEALTESLALADYAAKLYILNPDKRFWAAQQTIDLLKNNPKVSMLMGSAVSEIQGNANVQSVLVSGSDGAVETLSVDGVFNYMTGDRPATDITNGQVDLDDIGYVKVGKDLQSSVPGVFAVGDVRGNDVRQVITSAADGARAAVMVDKMLRQQAKGEIEV